MKKYTVPHLHEHNRPGPAQCRGRVLVRDTTDNVATIDDEPKNKEAQFICNYSSAAAGAPAVWCRHLFAAACRSGKLPVRLGRQ